MLFNNLSIIDINISLLSLIIFKEEAKVSVNQENLDLPKALQMDINHNNQNEISLTDAGDIIQQINDYIDQEKKNLNEKGEGT